MNIKEQMRQATISNRSQDKNRQAKALGRAAHQVGLSVEDATSHAWKSPIA